MFRPILKFLGSLTFAIILLSVIIVATAVGTVYETTFNADVAQKYIYGHWWFNLWLTGLAVNLFCVAAVRYPWKRHQTGFVITHAGIITLLAGAMIDRLAGVEGFMHLYTTKQGGNVMELHQQEVRVKIGDKVALTHFKVSTLWNALPLNSPSPNVKIDIQDVQPVLPTEIAAPAATSDHDAKPGLNYTLQGPMMGRNDGSIFLDERDELREGTSILFVPGMPAVSAAKPDVSADLLLELRGKSFKIKVNYGETKTQDLDGLPGWKLVINGYFPNFVLNAKNAPDTRDLQPKRPVIYFELLGPDVKGVVLKDTDPHSGPAGKQDVNLTAPQHERLFAFSNETPLMNVPVHGPPTEALAKVVPHKTTQAPSLIATPNGVAFYLGEDGKLRYLIKHTPKSAMADGEEAPAASEKMGEVEYNKPVAVGWAPGAEFVVHELIENAERKAVFVPHPELKTAKDQESLNQGLKCIVTIGSESKELWVGQTEVERTYPQSIEVAGTKVNFEFVNECRILPFTVALKDFRAPTDEGSNEFAAFESTIAFKNMDCIVTLRKGFRLCKSNSDPSDVPVSQNYMDPIHYDREGQIVLDGVWQGQYKPEFNRYTVDAYMKRMVNFQTAAGTIRIQNDAVDNVKFKNTERSGNISMNRPTTFPSSWWGPWLGTCYKFSQANHKIIPGDPKHSDPTYSGVQVLFDPGWFFKWVGCIMICFGIFTMFYLRPYFYRPKAKPAALAQIVQPHAAIAAMSVNQAVASKKKNKRV